MDLSAPGQATAFTAAFFPLLFWWAFFIALAVVGVVGYGLEHLERNTRALRWRVLGLPLLRGKRPYCRVRVTVRWWVSVRTGVE